ncbi:MAG: galactose mutarotase [Ruminiclostridium sp.]|nr:galactose mutarotase [Ruminiclostridium sp.]
MSITCRSYGFTKEGAAVIAFTLSNANGLQAEIINYGGIITKLSVPDKKGDFDDITLGFDNLDGYLKGHPYFGAIVGRYANRIEDAQFELNGKIYELYKNIGDDHLHGGLKGFDKAVWIAETVQSGGDESLQLTYRSVDGEEGYPGNLDIKVTYFLSKDNELIIDYFAVSDSDTVVNLTNHAYFNLCGHEAGDISGHEVMIDADSFTAVSSKNIPTGEIRKVEGTPMDLRVLKPLAAGLSSAYEQIIKGDGYDHNWVLNTAGDISQKAAEVYERTTGRILEVYTTKPGIQLYTGNFLDEMGPCKEGAAYKKREGFCLETQYFPNSMKHKHFPSPILKSGQVYTHKTIYKFKTIKVS